MKSLMLKAAKEAGKIVMKYYGNPGKLKYKNIRSIVTKADLLSEKKIMEIVGRKFPEHNFLAEESGLTKKGSEYTWIIDPIDGTTNFVSNIPEFVVSIALAKNNEVIMGTVYNPCTKDMYFAEKGKGSYLNGKRLQVSKKNKLNEAIATFSLPSNINISRKTLRILSRSYGTFRGVRNFGSAALNLCYIAGRRMDLYFTLDIRPWDAAAAKLIVEEAGGKVTNIKNRKWGIKDNTIAASNKVLHNKFIKIIK
ncbi:MAG: inositol monophosphatase family protein [Nanoarchaeota archaeon]